MRWVVYVLADPRTGDIRYVGGSNNPQRRLKEHLYDCAVPENSKRQWIQELKRLNMLPLVVEIMDCDSEKQLSEEEIHWTRRLRLAGCDLVNHS